MTPTVYNFVKSLKLTGKTLDVGSYSVNGNVRNLFSDYTGLDMREGPNVDIVASSHAMPLSDKIFDAVVCLEMLEHDDNPFQSVSEMVRVLKPSGTLVLTACGIGFPRHDFPSDYWRFTEAGLVLLMRGLVDVKTAADVDHVYGTGRKPS
jgi:SAM-dependent methyltransferase